MSGLHEEASVADPDVETTVFHWHGETFDLPPGATPSRGALAASSRPSRLGRAFLGIQFHLETTPQLLQGMISQCRGELVPSRFVQSESEILSSAPARFAAVNRLMVDTLEHIAGADALGLPIDVDL